jgi:ribonuclease Z
MKRILLGIVGLVLLLAVIGYAMRTRIVLRMMDRVVAANIATNLLQDLPDGLYVGLCGAGSPLPDPKRSGPCTVVFAGDQLYIVDSGAGSPRILSQMRVPQGEIDAVFLTHMHSDHIDGLGELQLMRWANGGHTEPLPVYGPEEVDEVVDGFNVAYSPSRRFRVAHHGESVVPSSGAGAVAMEFAAPADGEGLVLVEQGGLVVTAFRVDHDPVDPAVGYRFDYAGRSVLISGDTVKSANLQSFAKGVDVLIHEALAPNLVEVLTNGAKEAGRDRLAKITTDILDYHASPVDAAEVARDAGVGVLVYNHIVPPLLLAPMEDLFLEGVSDVYDGPLTIGRDGTFIRLEAGKKTIEIEELL